MKSQRLDLFDRKTELLHLWLPALLCAGYLPFAVLGLDGVPDSQAWLRWIAGILFMNSIHTVFSLRNLISMPEYRQLMHELKISPLRLGLIFWLLFCVFFLFRFKTPYSMGGVPKALFFAFTLFLPTAHGLRQTLGIGLLYNQRFLQQATSGARTAEERSRGFEHLANWLLIAGITCPWMGQQIPELKAWSTPIADFSYVLLALSFLLFIACVAVVPDQSFRRKKGYFLLRMLPHYLVNSFYFSIFYAQCRHGAEYLFIDREMRSKSRNRSLVVWGVVVTVVVALIKVHAERWFRPLGLPFLAKPAANRLFFAVGFTFTGAVTYFHYYVDSIVFRLGNPIVRKIIGPLMPAGPREAAVSDTITAGAPVVVDSTPTAI